jgi:hypothetical protein
VTGIRRLHPTPQRCRPRGDAEPGREIEPHVSLAVSARIVLGTGGFGGMICPVRIRHIASLKLSRNTAVVLLTILVDNSDLSMYIPR